MAGTQTVAKRQSNIELLRIVGMLMIVAHHYVVNSGVLLNVAGGGVPSPDNGLASWVFLSLWGMWGKTGINVFILISGYFMCTSRLTVKRYCRVFFEWLFYVTVLYVILLAIGYETLSAKRLVQVFFYPFISANGSGSFMASFLVFYLFIPVMNRLIGAMDRRQYRAFVLLLLFVFTVLSTFFLNRVIFGEVFWFCAVYFMGGYLRLYPPAWSQSLRASGRLLLGSLVLCWASVLAIIAVQQVLGTTKGTFYFVVDANKLGAVLVGVFLFTTFKNLRLGYSRVINLVAKTTFGVLLIHANSNAMRQLLWHDLLHVDVSWTLPVGLLALRSVAIVAGVFCACSLIDMVRIYLVERPVFAHFDVIEERIVRVGAWCQRVGWGAYGVVTSLALGGETTGGSGKHGAQSSEMRSGGGKR